MQEMGTYESCIITASALLKLKENIYCCVILHVVICTIIVLAII